MTAVAPTLRERATRGTILTLGGQAGSQLLRMISNLALSRLLFPEAFGLLFTFFYMRGAQPSQLWTRFRSWQLDRDLKKRSAHLKGIDGGRRNVGGDSDKYLH